MIINVNVTTSYHQEYMYSRRIIGFLLVNCTFVRFLTLDQTQPDPPNTENFVTRPEPWVDPTCVQLWSQYTQHKISSGSILIFQEAWSPLFVVSIRGHGTNAGIILPSNKSKNGVCQNLEVCALDPRPQNRPDHIVTVLEMCYSSYFITQSPVDGRQR